MNDWNILFSEIHFYICVCKLLCSYLWKQKMSVFSNNLEKQRQKIKKVYKLDLVFNNLSDRLRTGTNKIALIWQIFQNTIFNARKYFSLSFTFFFPFNERSQRLMRFGRTFLRTESCQGIYSCKQVKRRSFAYLLGYTAALILPFNFHSKTHTVSCNWEESWLNIRSSQLI